MSDGSGSLTVIVCREEFPHAMHDGRWRPKTLRNVDIFIRLSEKLLRGG
jgi:hypothetical protein